MKNLFYLPLILLLVFTAGCKKSDPAPTITKLTYTNSVFTDIAFVHNGTTTIIHPGNQAEFTGTPGTTFEFTATSSGQTSDGTQLGVGLEWSGPNTFPSSGTYGSEFKLDPSDFFLYVTNNSDTLTVVKLTTNAGSTDEIVDEINIGPDKTQYSIGYYKRFSNTIIQADYVTSPHNTTGYTELVNPTYSQDNSGNYYLDFIVHN